MIEYQFQWFMEDPVVDWVAALTGVSTAVTIAKDLRALDKSFDEATHKAQIVTLLEQLTDVKLQILDAREEAARKDQTITQLRSDLEYRKTK